MAGDVTAKPFQPDEGQEKWVTDNPAAMTLEEKVGQLFCPAMSSFSKKNISHMTDDLHIGSIMIRPFPVKGL